MVTIEELVRRNVKILIADDLRASRVELKKCLMDLGFSNVVEAESGQQVLDELERDAGVELIISDWGMPDMDGSELVDKLLEDARWSQIPFIVSTARAQLDSMVQASMSGVWGYVVKPVNPQELADEIVGVFNDPELCSDSEE